MVLNVHRNQTHKRFKRTLIIYYDIGNAMQTRRVVYVIINKRSFESFICLDLILERQQSFLFQIFVHRNRKAYQGRGEGGERDMEVRQEADYIPIATLSPPE